MGFPTFHRFVYIQDKLRNALLKGDNPKLIATINSFSSKDRIDLDFSCNMWQAALSAFIHCIKDKSTHDVLLAYNERLRLVSNTLFPPSQDERPNAYAYDQTLGELSDLLRQRRKDVGGTASVSGLVIPGTLATSLPSRYWITIIQSLSATGYVAQKYLLDVNLIERWMFSALSFLNEETIRPGSLVKLKWDGTPKALAEFIIGIHQVGILDFDIKNRALLYQWIDNWIHFDGEIDSLKTYLKTENEKLNWFIIQIEPFEFKVLLIARKVKQSKS